MMLARERVMKARMRVIFRSERFIFSKFWRFFRFLLRIVVQIMNSNYYDPTVFPLNVTF